MRGMDSPPRDATAADRAFWSESALLQWIADRTEEVLVSIDTLRAAVSDLQTAAQDEHNELDAVVTELSAVEGQLTQLQTQVAQGGGVTQADLDAVASQVSGIAAAARSAVESAKTSTAAAGGGGTPTPAPAPAPAPGPAPTTDPAGGTPTPDPVAPTDPAAPPTPAPAPAPTPTPDTGGGTTAQRTLYAFGGDPSTVDQSVWPPAGVQTDEPSPRPLFTYSGDQNAGDTNGEGVGGLWTAYTGTTQPMGGSGGEA